MDRALEEFLIDGRGVKTTIPFHRRVLADERFRSGDVDTGFLEGFSYGESAAAAAASGCACVMVRAMADDDRAVPAHVLDYLGEQKTMTLATASPSGVPHAGTFMYANDGLALYFWARPQSTTAQHIEQNPIVSLAIGEYAEDPRQTRGVQATGQCGVVLGGDEIVTALGLFSDKFSSGSSGASTTNISFFRITPTELFYIDNREGRGGEASADEFGFSYNRNLAFSAIGGLPERSSPTMSAELQTIQVPAGDVVVREGAPADKFFIVLDGEVELVREGDEGPLAKLTSGQFFGEMAILRDAPRSATVRAAAATTLMVMDRDTFRGLVAQSLGTTDDFDQVLRDRFARLGAGQGS
jgi:nitroimidazol reductase NimA-like FMN-containing flavoprotein (pyridoxamine 5'-phosphate oxidase superfamily)